VPALVVPVLLLVVGAVLLTAGAEAFAEHLAPAAARLGVTVLALGVLLAGAEPEEAVTAMFASGQGQPVLAAGDAIGANLVILTLTLGLAALLSPLPVGRRVLQYGLASAAAGAVAVVLL
jgi:cation:H+ antiporter